MEPLQPMNLDLGFERLEFAVAGYQLGIALFSQSCGKSVGVGNFVAAFVIGGLQNRGPAEIDTLETDFRAHAEPPIGLFSCFWARQRIPDSSPIPTAAPCVFSSCC